MLHATCVVCVPARTIALLCLRASAFPNVSIKYIMKIYISLEQIHTQTTVHLYSVHKLLKHKSVEIWMHCDQDEWSRSH
jgi:hypothetical protein